MRRVSRVRGEGEEDGPDVAPGGLVARVLLRGEDDSTSLNSPRRSDKERSENRDEIPAKVGQSDSKRRREQSSLLIYWDPRDGVIVRSHPSHAKSDPAADLRVQETDANRALGSTTSERHVRRRGRLTGEREVHERSDDLERVPPEDGLPLRQARRRVAAVVFLHRLHRGGVLDRPTDLVLERRERSHSRRRFAVDGVPKFPDDGVDEGELEMRLNLLVGILTTREVEVGHDCVCERVGEMAEGGDGGGAKSVVGDFGDKVPATDDFPVCDRVCFKLGRDVKDAGEDGGGGLPRVVIVRASLIWLGEG